MNPDADPKIRYTEIARQLKEEIVAGKYGTDGRMPSETQLVNRYKVSRPTIARALRVLSDEGMVERRAGSGTFIKEGGKDSNRLLAFLIPNLGNTEIFHLIGGEISRLARMHGYGLVWENAEHSKPDPSPDVRQLESMCRQFIERRVSGVFMAPLELVKGTEQTNQAMAEMLRDAGMPVVLLDRDLTPFPVRSDFDLVGIDNIEGGFALGEHLLKLGCTRIHFVARSMSASSVDGRIAGVRQALSRRRLRPDPNWIHIGDPEDKKFIRQLIGPCRPDACVCANDHTAVILMRELQKNHIKVPSDMRVVGFDDLKFASFVSPPLTTIQQPCREIALTAFRAMMGRLENATLPACHLSISPRLVIRDSCGAYLPRS